MTRPPTILALDLGTTIGWALGYQPSDDNEADALAIFHYAREGGLR